MVSSRRPIYLNPAPATASCAGSLPVQAFHESFPGYVPSPLVALPEIAHELGVHAVYVKQESNRFGLPAFKVLGASWAIYRAVLSSLSLPNDTALATLVERIREEAARTLIAATEGNHGRAVARVAQQMSLRCRIYVPRTMHEYTCQMIRSEGAELVVVDGDYDQAVQAAATAAAELAPGILIQDTAFEGYEEIPAWIVEGYATLLREADAQLHALGLQNSLVVAPVGVGSFAQAVVSYYKSRESPATVVAVEPDTAATLTTSLQRNTPTPVTTSPSIMAGMNCGTVSTAAWPQLRQLVDASVTVSDWESHCAVQQLATQSVDAGPCGAASLAAIRRLKAEHDTAAFFSPESVILLLSTEGRRPYDVPVDVSPDDAVELTQVLTRINSSNPTLSQSEGAGETAIVDYLSAWFAHRDIEHHRVETVPGRPSVVGIVRGTGGGASLMLNGHVDTVSLATYEQNALSGHLGVKDGKEVVFGRGTLDMKAGLAAGLSALLVAQRTPLAGDVLVAAVADEEDASQGTMDVLAAGWRADAGVVLEPTNLAIAHAHKGFVWVELEVLGRAAHGSQPADGVDAIMNMGLLLQALREYQPQLHVDEVLGQGSLHCGLIQGGEEVSSYPARCRLTVEFRTVPAQTHASILADLGTILARLAEKHPGFEYQEPRIGLSRPSQHVPPEHPLVQQLVALGTDVMGHSPEVKSVPFWCDAALLTAAGVPSVVFGPSGAGLHSKEEWVEVDSIRTTDKVWTGGEVDNGHCRCTILGPDWLSAPSSAHPSSAPASTSEWLHPDALFPDPPDPPHLPAIASSDPIRLDDWLSPYLFAPKPTVSQEPIDPTDPAATVPPIDPPTEDFVNVSRWLDGAYRPPVPCLHCQHKRLQCLILRTTPANPNPISSCSSCVALFRECSLARGEKRLPAGFETVFPVFGHLHGVTEFTEAQLSAIPEHPGEPGHIKAEEDIQYKTRFSRKGAKVLRDWLYRNPHDPYPTDGQKATFAQQTDLTEKQIATWFANARRRQKMARRSSRSGRSGQGLRRSNSPMPVPRSATLTPMERWQRSPPDEEPVSESVIRNAIATTGADPMSERPGTYPDSSPSADELASSISSLDSGQSQASSGSFSSAWSHHSEDYPPFPFSGRRSSSQPRRRRPRRQSLTGHPYQCTFCPDSFKKKHDWARHEKSVHLSLESWVCNIDAGHLDSASPAESPCDFCSVFPAPQSHVDTHEFDVCVDRPLPERTFRRKDHMIQHLRKFHRCTKTPAPRIDPCRVVASQVPSRCGFCGRRMTTWTERADHLAEHFKAGRRMVEWSGDWGLDSPHQAILREATLPCDRSSYSRGIS
ncbi:hypothetical protein BO71DRAFT_385155 [Aspergillus ellipticus CBS 707.79]|uniref:Acetylornithine deacetylase n=1 Tax=Aspergillus ellipticus CBS 707.79 TaxID=1448320 RepID=A0A319DBD3_9EURO|nr:hypothetical protein BO71DRAFT_385155 [Aspergillus ellipticus CBS 707.79]